MNPPPKTIVLFEFDSDGTGNRGPSTALPQPDERGHESWDYLTVTRLTRSSGSTEFSQKVIRLNPEQQKELYTLLAVKFREE